MQTSLPIAFTSIAYIGLVNLVITNTPNGGNIGNGSCRDVGLDYIGIVGCVTEGVTTNNAQGIVIGV